MYKSGRATAVDRGIGGDSQAPHNLPGMSACPAHTSACASQFGLPTPCQAHCQLNHSHGQARSMPGTHFLPIIVIYLFSELSVSSQDPFLSWD